MYLLIKPDPCRENEVRRPANGKHDHCSTRKQQTPLDEIYNNMIKSYLTDMINVLLVE